MQRYQGADCVLGLHLATCWVWTPIPTTCSCTVSAAASPHICMPALSRCGVVTSGHSLTIQLQRLQACMLHVQADQWDEIVGCNKFWRLVYTASALLHMLSTPVYHDQSHVGSFAQPCCCCIGWPRFVARHCHHCCRHIAASVSVQPAPQILSIAYAALQPHTVGIACRRQLCAEGHAVQGAVR